MTNKQINAAIAEACGWEYHDGWHHPDGRIELPNYCIDLNAMRDIEEYAKDRREYLEILKKLTNGLESASIDNDWFFCRATARQRATAFLGTLGKWEEVQK